jgi:apoptosis-inducing factor 3
MSEAPSKPEGPDFSSGIALASITGKDMLQGHVQGVPVLLARRGDEFFALDAACTHYSGPLAEGLLVGDTVRCPWHHACFSLRTGAALHAPALNPLACWRVEQRDGMIYVREKIAAVEAVPVPPAMHAGRPDSIVIVGGGAAGNAAAEMLRREGFGGRITMLSADSSIPYDRPNLSKNYLAGNAPAEWIPLRSMEFYREHQIDLRLNAEVSAIDPAQRQVSLADGSRLSYDALLLATGATPNRLSIPGADLPHVHLLRSLDDCNALIATAQSAQRAVVIGSSFIGLEAAAALRARNIDVQVVGRDNILMERLLGPELGAFVQRLHEAHGVTFHLGTSPARIDADHVTLENGATLAADLVVVGIGVQPALGLAQQAGLALDRGVLVNAYLQTSIPGIFAAGDIARWPDPLNDAPIRVEHWVVAERQGQTAARNMLGRRERYEAVPFFWTEQYDFALAYSGHAAQWDQIDIDGSLDARDCTLVYRYQGKKLAVATIQRDLECLRAELEFEHTIAARAKPAHNP